MNTENIFTLKRQAIIALVVATAFPALTFAAAGRVEFAIGGATAISKEGSARNLTKGVDINSGDTIKTTDGRVQVRFTDGGYMSLQPNTEFIVENYAYDGKQDGAERGFFRLVEGGLRAITGVVGRNNRPAYRVATPVATIGIRGSEFLAEHRANRLRTRVIGGSIFLENEFGNLILFKGQGSETNQGQSPEYSDDESGVLAKGPDGGQPNQTQKDAQQDRDSQTVFAVNDQYGEDGESIAVAEGNIIAQYAAANAVGYYDGQTSDVTGLNSSYTGTIDSAMDVYFGDFKVENTIELTISPTGSSGFSYSTELSGTGTLGSNGSISIPTFTDLSGGEGFVCDSSCTASATGALSGSLAESAALTYKIDGLSTFFAPDGKVSGTVDFDEVEIIADGGSGATLVNIQND